jgi:capsular polysaccharide biosynthesis protein
MGKITFRAGAVCVVVALAVAGVAYGVGSLLTKTYQSYGLIRVALPSQQGIIDAVVTAANDTASQYAQLASSQPVQALTAKKLGVAPSTLDGKISGSTFGAQNLVQVTVTGRSRAAATARTSAATSSLLEYVSGLNASAGSSYLTEAQRGLADINRRLARITARLAKDRAAQRSTDTILANSLAIQQDQLQGQIARDAASDHPSLQLVDSATSPTLVSPQPLLYAAVAFVVALVVAVRVAFAVRRPEGR